MAGFKVAHTTNPNVESGGSFPKVEPGWYHFEVTRVQDNATDTNEPWTSVELVAHAGTVPEMKGRVHSEKFDWYGTSEKATAMRQDHLLNFAYITGAAKPSDVAAAQKGEKEFTFNWAAAVGKHFIAEVEDQKSKKNDEEKVYRKIGHRQIFAMDDPRVENRPRDKTAIGDSKMTEFL